MVRRRLALIALALAAVTAAACADATAPQPRQDDCGPIHGTGICVPKDTTP